jgi:hypothetical protein
MTFAEKLQEQVSIAMTDPVHAVGEARALIEQMANWPLSTQVPLSRVAQMIGGLMAEKPANVRRVIATDSVRLMDAA